MNIYKSPVHIFIKEGQVIFLKEIFLPKNFIKFWVLILIFFLSANKIYALSPSDLSAQSYILMEKQTGKVVFEKNAYQKMKMASTTKIMTGILALEMGKPDDIVKVSERAAYVEGSSMYLAPNEQIRLIDLIYGLMLNSGNDAATAIAEHLCKSEAEFAKQMTKKAVEIGANNTSFENPSGLDGDNHYTTAYDLALITRYALKNDAFAEIVKTKKKVIPWQGKAFGKTLVNHNKLLSMYEGCDGVKTGFTKKSGRTLVCSATRGGISLICVTLNAPNDWQDHTKLFDYAFSRLKLNKIIEKGQIMKTVSVTKGYVDKTSLIANDDLFLPIEANEFDKLSYEINAPQNIIPPVLNNEKIGEALIYYDKKFIKKIDLVTNEALIKLENKKIFMDSLNKIFINWLHILKNKNIMV